MNQPLIDYEQLNEFTENDADMVADLAVIFARAVPDYLAKLNVSIFESNAGELHEAGHQIKSQLSYFFCESLVNLAMELEEMGLQGTTENADAIARRLAEGIGKLLGELNHLTGLNLEFEGDEHC